MRGLLLLIGVLILTPVLGVNVIQVNTDRSVYTVGDNVSVSGVVLNNDVGVAGVSVSLSVFNGSDFIVNSVGLVTDSNGFFNYSFSLNSVSPRFYTLSVSDGSSSINSSFEVVSEMVYVDLSQVVSGSVVFVNTSSIDDSGFDLTEVSNNSPIRIGNASINGKTFYFLLADPDVSGVFDKVYIDDDKNFTLTNAYEGGLEGDYTESGPLVQGGSWNNSFSLIKVFSDGSGLILARPVSSISYSPSSSISVVSVAYNGSDSPVSGYPVNINLESYSGVISSVSGVTDSFGYYGSVFTAPSSTGAYFFNANDVSFSNFFVETFNARVSLTDVSGVNSIDFIPDEPVNLVVKVFDSAGNPVVADNIVANITNPNGVVTVIPFSSFSSSSSGVYQFTINSSLKSVEGGYSVRVMVVNNSNVLLKDAGFSVNSYSYKVITVNPRRLSSSHDERRISSTSFAPSDNITFAIMKVNNSVAGDFFMKLEDIASSNTDDSACSNLISIDRIVNSNGVEISPYNVSITTLYHQLQVYGDTGEPFIQRQCALVFNYNVTGTYRISISVNDGVKSSVIGASFSVQNLDSIAYPVSDSTSNAKLWAQAPNKTIYFKVRVKDLATDSFLPDANITDVKLLSVVREFPSFADVTRTITNISYSNATLSFNAPASEGGYSVKYLFNATTPRGVETGVGEAFMMLKKYIIYGVADCNNFFCSPNQNITLNVYAVDIDLMGSNSGTRSRNGNALSVQVDSIVNEDSFKTMVEGVDYTATTGNMNANEYNSTLNITPISLSPGFYSVRLTLRDLITNESFFGWAGFEVRNFIVSGDAYGSMGGGSAAYEAGSDSVVRFVVSVYNATNDFSPISINDYNVTLTGVQLVDSWPPSTISADSYSSVIGVESIPNYGGGFSDHYVVNITGLSSAGSYRATFRVNINGVEDNGEFYFSMSAFDVNAVYRDGWPPLYSSSENVSITLNAVNISSGAPYNLGVNSNVTVRDLFDVSVSQPVVDAVYSGSCSGSSCDFELNASSLSAGDEYYLTLRVTDSNNNYKDVNVFFRIQDLIVGVPFTEQMWYCRNDFLFDNFEINNDGSVINQARVELIDPDHYYSYSNPFYFDSSVFIASDGVNLWLSDSAFTCTDTASCNVFCDGYANCSRAVTGGTVIDPWGNAWLVTGVNNGSPISVILKGLNVTAGFGINIDTSFSASGDFILCFENESNMGSWSQLTGGRSGVDLNGDGDVVDNVYAVLIDNGSPRIYDSIIWSFSKAFNGSPVIISNSSPIERSFGVSHNITALNIYKYSDMWFLRYYVDVPGDWSDLGEAGLNDDFRIPLMTYRPNGSLISGANVSLPDVFYSSSNSFSNIDLVSACGYEPNTSLVNGIGELELNIGDCGYGFSAGDYSFNVKGEFDGETSFIDPWVKPRITLRTYKFSIISDFPTITQPLHLNFSVMSYNGSPISGANITIQMFTGGWPQTVFSDYNVSPVVAVSDDNGSAMMTLTPTNTWSYGCYLIKAFSVAVLGNESQTYWSCFW